MKALADDILDVVKIMISLWKDKILHWSKMKALADDILDVVKIMISLWDRLENTMGKGENAENQHFLLFPQCFPKSFFPFSLVGWGGGVCVCR